MFRTRTQQELDEAQKSNDEQARVHLNHILGMMPEANRRALADQAAAAATYAENLKTAAERRQQRAEDKAAERRLCTSPYPETGPHYDIVTFAIDNTSIDYEETVAAMSDDDKRQGMQFVMSQADLELEARGQAPLSEKEKGKIVAFLLYHRISMLSAENILIAFSVLCDEAGMRRPTEVAIKEQAEQQVVAQAEHNPFGFGKEGHDEWDRQHRLEQAAKEVAAVGLPNNPALAENVQQMRVHLGVAIDNEIDPVTGKTVDEMSSAEYLRYVSKKEGKNIGTASQRLN